MGRQRVDYKNFKSFYHAGETGSSRPLTQREHDIQKIMRIREMRQGIPLPPSPLFERQHARYSGPDAGEYILGPWKGALKSDSLAYELVGKLHAGGKRMTQEQVEQALKILASVEARTERSIPVTERAAAVTTVKTTPVQEKPKVQILEKELRHKFDCEKNLVIEINDTCWNKMQCWINMTTKEISGLGCVKQTKGGKFVVYDVFLFEQENTYTFTDIDDLAVQKLMLELDEMDEKDGGTRFQDMKFWWHSHAELEVQWSTQDDHNIEKKLFGDNTDGKAVCPWWLSVVLNKKGKVNTRLDIAQPWLTLERIGYRVKNTIPKEIVDFCKAEYDKKVKEPTATVVSSTASAYGRGFSRYYGGETEDEMYGGDFDWKKDGKGGTTGFQSRPLEQTKGQTPLPGIDQEAYITKPDGGKGLFKATSLQAYRYWENEIVAGMVHLYQTCLELGIRGSEITGLAFRPAKIPNISTKKIWDAATQKHTESDDQYEWIVFGNVKNLDYLLTVWPEANSMHLGRILTLSESSGGARVPIINQVQYNERYGRIGIGTYPTWDYTDATCECAVGLILSYPNSERIIPVPLLGDIFVNDDIIKDELGTTTETEKEKADRTAWETDDGEWGEPVNTAKSEEKVETGKDTVSQSVVSDPTTTEIAEEEESLDGDLYDDMISFAASSHKSDIVTRIHGWLLRMERDTVIDAIEMMQESLEGDNNPEHNLSAMIAGLSDGEVIEVAMNLVKGNHEEAFADIFMVLKAMAYCPGCYEPLHESVQQCPQCRMHITMN